MKSASIKTTYKLADEFERDINKGIIQHFLFEDGETSYLMPISNIPDCARVSVHSTAGWSSTFRKIGGKVEIT